MAAMPAVRPAQVSQKPPSTAPNQGCSTTVAMRAPAAAMDTAAITRFQGAAVRTMASRTAEAMPPKTSGRPMEVRPAPVGSPLARGATSTTSTESAAAARAWAWATCI